MRPPLAQDRVQLVEGDLVRLVFKRPFSDGTFALELDPLCGYRPWKELLKRSFEHRRRAL